MYSNVYIQIIDEKDWIRVVRSYEYSVVFEQNFLRKRQKERGQRYGVEDVRKEVHDGGVPVR